MRNQKMYRSGQAPSLIAPVPRDGGMEQWSSLAVGKLAWPLVAL
jgi:hypothetical protein